MEDRFPLLARCDPLSAFGDGEAGAGRSRYVLLDVFTSAPLAGNPLAVFTDGREIPPRRMQELARELNLSETVFLLPPQEGGDVRARIFTPLVELPFAGHPVLGAGALAARVLGGSRVALETAAGKVPVEAEWSGPGAASASMKLPAPSPEAFDRAETLLRALGVRVAALPVEQYRNGPCHVLVALADEAAVAALDPDLSALARIGELAVSCFAGGGRRWNTRVFAPALGVPEDPATGSAAAPLAVHLARHGRIPIGEVVDLHQGAEIGRPSLLRVTVEGRGGDGQIDGVSVAGGVALIGGGEIVA